MMKESSGGICGVIPSCAPAIDRRLMAACDWRGARVHAGHQGGHQAEPLEEAGAGDERADQQEHRGLPAELPP